MRSREPYWYNIAQIEHISTRWLSAKYGIKIQVNWTAEGLFVADLVVGEGAKGNSLLGTARKVVRDLMDYVDHTGETLYGVPQPPTGFDTDKGRLRKFYERCGCGYDEDKGIVVYPACRVGCYEVLGRGKEKYEGIL